jgi:hypothetical protein
MSVNVKELNSKRLDRICSRSEFPLLARIFVMGLVSWEQTDQKTLTCLYRNPFREVLGKLDQHLKKGIYSALTGEYREAGDKVMQDNLQRYLEVQTYKRCPLEIGSGESS